MQPCSNNKKEIYVTNTEYEGYIESTDLAA